MTTETERKVIGLLKGGHALSEAGRRAIINELGAEGRGALRRIAQGKLQVEHPKLRGKAVIALGFDEGEPAESVEVLRGLLAGEEPVLKVRALRALGRLGASAVADEVRALVRDPDTRADVALAAARVAVGLGQEEVAGELRDLRKRLLRLASSPQSPSILSLDELIARAESGAGAAPAEEEPKQDV
ncbi:MAG: HEAT repeat domain-containing protein [Planctomycetota bacterium]|jgi:hypothetical protein